MKITLFTWFLSSIVLTYCQHTEQSNECYDQGPCNDGYMDRTNGEHEQWTYCGHCNGGEYYADTECKCACIPTDGCDGGWIPSIGAYIGMGIGLGLSSSFFFAVGLNQFFTVWSKAAYEDLHADVSMRIAPLPQCFAFCVVCFCRLVVTAFLIPFVMMPIILYLSLQNFVIAAVGYGAPFIYSKITRRGFVQRVLRNPCKRQSEAEQPEPPAIELVSLQKQSQPSEAVSNQSQPIHDHQSEKQLLWNQHEMLIWLSGIGLLEYYKLLLKHGYQSMTALQTITAADLEGMGITKQSHIKKILSGKGLSVVRVEEASEGGHLMSPRTIDLQ